MSHTVTRSGNQGQTPYKTGSAGLDPNTLLDFETATFILDNQPSTIDGDGTNYWPVNVRNSPGVIIDGGTIQGEINMTGDWRTVYDYGNSAGVTVEYSPGVIVRDWRMTNVRVSRLTLRHQARWMGETTSSLLMVCSCVLTFRITKVR